MWLRVFTKAVVWRTRWGIAKPWGQAFPLLI